jgi:hypothetical protein
MRERNHAQQIESTVNEYRGFTVSFTFESPESMFSKVKLANEIVVRSITKPTFSVNTSLLRLRTGGTMLNMSTASQKGTVVSEI